MLFMNKHHKVSFHITSYDRILCVYVKLCDAYHKAYEEHASH